MWATHATPPAELAHEEFDFVFSNSVLEHVGGHWRRARFAETVRSLAPHYWVQTPNKYFPIEPHWFFPGAQFLPIPMKLRLTMYWPVGNYGRRRSAEEAIEDLMAVELVGASELEYYFPDATVIRERVAGLGKSLIAVR